MVFNTPTTGHVNPTLPVVAELARRGHEVVYWLSEGYRAKIEATGATFRAYADIPDDYFEQRGLDGSMPTRSALELAKTTREIVPGLLETVRAEQPDVLLYDSMCPWGWLLGAVTGIPSAASNTVLLMTPAQMFRMVGVAGLLPMLALGMRGLSAQREFRAVARRLEQEYGIKAPFFTDFLMARGTITISYTSRMFQPHADSLPDSIKFVGPSIEPRADHSGFPFDALDGRPLVYISLGTIINANLDFFRQCLEAFGDGAYQVVMSIGSRIDPAQLGAIPEHFIVRAHVPQLEILQRAALFVSHAGMNSVHEGLYYEVPLVLVPQQMEQRMVAARVGELGAGVPLLRQPVTAAMLREAAGRVLGDPSTRERAAALGASLREAGGHCRAADEIEQLAGKKE